MNICPPPPIIVLTAPLGDWGAWCPDGSGGKITEKNYDQYIQIDLLNLTRTQGRKLSQARDYVN